jgi:hypothetical protein
MRFVIRAGAQKIIGVHTPKFGYENDVDNAQEAVRQANIRYPVVPGNRYPRGNAYAQRFWPAWYPSEADGFVRCRHFGKSNYYETEARIQRLPAEKDRIAS